MRRILPFLVKIFVLGASLGSALTAQEARVRPAPQVSMPLAIDSNSPAFWRDGTLYWFGSHGGPWLNAGPSQFGPWQRQEVGIEGSEQPWPKWIEAVWPEDNRTLWGWYHAEPSGLVPDSTLTAPRIGAMLSVDGGVTFRDLGVVLESGEALNSHAQNGYFAGGHGDFSVILDRERRYFYFFFGNYGGASSTQGVCVARMAFEDRANPNGKVWKYYDGAWQEAGRGGKVTPIFPVARSWATRDPDAFWGPSVHWNTHLNCYVMLLNHALGEPGWAQEGVYVSFASDLTRPETWTAPVKILGKEEFSGWYFFYPQVMGLEADGTDRRAGKVARLYVGGISKWEIEFVAPNSAPTGVNVATFPAAGSVTAGQPISLSVAPMGEPPFTYQWFKDGVPISGATDATLAIASPALGDAGVYHVVVENALGLTPSNSVTVVVTPPAVEPPVVSPAPPPTPVAYLSNLSVRAMLTAVAPELRVGYVIRGDHPKSLLLRAVGPTLNLFGVSDAVADPRLRLYDGSGTEIAQNDDWSSRDAERFASVGAFALAPQSGDAALVAEVSPGSGTATIDAAGEGVVLAEIYDPAPSREAKIINMSARGHVDAGHSLIGGFSVSGGGSKRVLIRALGPQLAVFGVTAALAKPAIEIYQQNGTSLARNAGWDEDLVAVFESAGAPGLPSGSDDAALAMTLEAGRSYSAVVRSADGTAGEVLLEIYELPTRASR